MGLQLFSIMPTYVGVILGMDIGPNACATFLRLQLVRGEWRGLDGNPLIYALSKFVKLTIE